MMINWRMTRGTRWDVSARLGAFVALVVTVLFVAGCATMRGAGNGDTDDVIDVQVQNNLVPPTSLSVSMLPGTGAREQIGFVSPGQTKVLHFDPGTPAGPYRLLAETTGGAAVASRQFYLAAADEVVWDLSLNTIRVVESDQ